MFDRNDILADLRDNVAEVTFKRIDGTPRHIKCTLMPSLLPPNYNAKHLHDEHQRAENLQTIVCWSLDDKAWKSFRIENVELVQIVANY